MAFSPKTRDRAWVGTIHVVNMQKSGLTKEQYENPDGTPITFDEDYFGNKRGINVIPGPFASAEFAQTILW